MTPKPYHPLSALFPLMEGAEYEALKADIRDNGLLEAICLHPDGSIIDGRNRYRACLDLGIEPRFRTWDGKRSLVSFVVSRNLHRRHLTPGQRAAVAVEILPLLEAERAAKEQERKRHQNERTAERFPQSAGKSRDQAAAAAGVNAHYVTDAKLLKAEAPDLFEQVRAGEITIPEANTILRRAKRIEKIQEISVGNMALQTTQTYPVLLADPPWEYEHCKTDNREIENHYPTMSLAAICALPVANCVTADAVLFLWATSPKLAEAMQVLDAWGFTYRTCMVWVKDKIGMGYYARQQHELLLVATRGKLPVPKPQNRPSSIVNAPRLAHSAKPERFYELIEVMYPEYHKLELFSRQSREGWDSWGNQA